MPKFRAEILSQNTSTVPKLLAQNFGIEKLAGIFGLKTMPKFHAERIGLKWHFGGQMYRGYMPNLMPIGSHLDVPPGDGKLSIFKLKI